MCNGSDRGFQSRGRITSRFDFKPVLVCNDTDQLMGEIRQESPWTMMFADDLQREETTGGGKPRDMKE